MRSLRTIACSFCIVFWFVGPAAADVSRPARRTDRGRVFTVTAYCRRGKTASGQTPRFGIAAADPRILPIGSVIRVGTNPGDAGTFTIQDVGGRVRARSIDLYTADCATAKRFGRRTMPVQIISLAPPSSPRTRTLLALSAHKR
jgi:3D (Asp-Asp-Asp) domain-containing protein